MHNVPHRIDAIDPITVDPGEVADSRNKPIFLVRNPAVYDHIYPIANPATDQIIQLAMPYGRRSPYFHVIYTTKLAGYPSFEQHSLCPLSQTQQ
jgi:hypothetical protein